VLRSQVVLGARGPTGVEIVKYLKAKGHPVVAVARNATKEVKDGVSWVPGDVTVPETLDEVRRLNARPRYAR
jgi:putative NADH-flavin reductase